MHSRCTPPGPQARLAGYREGGTFLDGFTFPILTASATAQQLFDIVRAPSALCYVYSWFDSCHLGREELPCKELGLVPPSGRCTKGFCWISGHHVALIWQPVLA